ncbi:MAG: DOMON-like domain-containing protein [Novosphingobium sp.]|nr:DOMON-like domain-containing protein [Novosphingobium sp.]
MGTHRLLCHPDTPPKSVKSIGVTLAGDAKGGLLLRWRIEGCADLIVPEYAGSGRADELWKTTCFELFVKAPDGAAYAEFNFSPSHRWAAYRFDSYRAGMANLDMPDSPQIDHQMGERYFVMTVKLPDLHASSAEAALSAVIEERDGTKSFWALAHAAGQPDFHAPACFAAAIPAADAP